MGTTADKLQAVLNSKEAIKTKFSLPDDMPFSQYAENIQAGGGEAAIYQCTDVTVEPTEGVEAHFPLNAIPIEGEIAGQIKTTSNVMSNSTVSTIDGIQGITFANGNYVAMVGEKQSGRYPYRNSTVAFWIVPVAGQDVHIFSTAEENNPTGGISYAFGFRLQNGNLVIAGSSYGSYPLEIGKLQHIVIENSTLGDKPDGWVGDKPWNLYINGVNTGYTGFWKHDGYLGPNNIIHGLFSVKGEPTPMFLSDFRIYNYAMSAKEVNALYRSCIGENVKNWAGYKANRVEDYYELSDTVTSGLTYTRMIPEVGKIYDAEATFEVAKLQEPPPPPGSLKVSGFPEPFYVPMGQINNPNGLWTLGRYSYDTGYVADPTATGTDRAWLSPDGAALLYYAGGWYIDDIGAVQMGMGVYPNPQLDNPYREDGSSCEWYSMGELVNGGSIIPA